MGVVRISVDGGRCAWLDGVGWTVSVRGTDAAEDAADGGGEGAGLEVGESESAGACCGSRARGGGPIPAPPAPLPGVNPPNAQSATPTKTLAMDTSHCPPLHGAH